MAWIGFIVLLLIGLWLFIGGGALCYMSAGFSGRVGIGWIVPLAGCVIIYMAFKFAPFTIVIN